MAGDQVVDGVEIPQCVAPSVDQLGGIRGLWLAAKE